MTLAYGAGGDKTIQIPITTTHIWLTNLDGAQRVQYAVKDTPSWPTDWASLDPYQRALVKMVNTNLYLRKKVFFRYSHIGEHRDDTKDIPPEVRATVEVEPTNI
jgi:hypothetical protein